MDDNPQKIIIYLVFVVLLVLFATGCKTTTATNATQYTQQSAADSTATAQTQTQQGAALVHTTHVYDSVFTHVTIYKYDTITQHVIEKIVIEQQATHAGGTQTTAHDSTATQHVQTIETHARDSVAYLDTQTTRDTGRASFRTRLSLFLGAVGLFILLVVFLKLRRYIQ